MSTPFEIIGTVRLTAKGLARTRRRHPWVYETDLYPSDLRVAGLVHVQEAQGAWVGIGLWSPKSKIRLRMLSFGEQTFDRSTFRQRIQNSIQRRARTMPGAEALRLIHGEADELPGVFVDRYAHALVIQTTCAGADLLEPVLIEILEDLLKPEVIVLRDDVGARAKEGLRQHVTVVRGQPPVVAAYYEGSVRYEVNLLEDHKTGSFLDQAHNHLAVAKWAQGLGLDCFCYQGGFALQMAQTCQSVLALDQSEKALVRARKAAEAANVNNVEFRCADVFETLPALFEQGSLFDTIVLDPPAFASTQDTAESALRAYKEINRRALQLMSAGGVLVSCSCSGRIRESEFEEMLRSAALDAQRPLQILERRGAGPDHPVLIQVPETAYLKCYVAQVL